MMVVPTPLGPSSRSDQQVPARNPSFLNSLSSDGTPSKMTVAPDASVSSTP
jgi:hypothetical protein